MNGKEVFVLILGIVCIILCCILNKAKPNMDFYDVTIGSRKINYYVIEDVKKMYIEDVIESRTSSKAYFNKGELSVNKANLLLDIKSYFCSDKTGKKDCKEAYLTNSKLTLNKKDINPVNLTVMKDDSILYNGEYITDLSSVVKENGRYYFIVDLKQKILRTEKNIKLLFSVKVSG